MFVLWSACNGAEGFATRLRQGYGAPSIEHVASEGNGAFGKSDIEGKAAARMEPRGRERHRWANREVDMGGST